jgi:hypothetical protein
MAATPLGQLMGQLMGQLLEGGMRLGASRADIHGCVTPPFLTVANCSIRGSRKALFLGKLLAN